MINNDSIVTAYDEHLTLVEWLQKVEVLLKNGGLKETTLNDKGNATFSLTLTFNDGTKLESNAMTLESVNTALTSVNTALRNLRLDLDTESHRIDDLENEVDNKTTPLFGKYSILVPEDSAETNILPCSPSDNGKVLSVVNGEAQWASAGSGGTIIVKKNSPEYTISIPLNEYALGDTITLNEYPLTPNEFMSTISFYAVIDNVIEITGVKFLITYSIFKFGLRTIATCIKSGTVTENKAYQLSYIFATR